MQTISVHRHWRSLIVFLAVVLLGGVTIGMLTAPGTWYQGLEKPPFNPPNWLFAPVWTVLYVMIALAGWRTYATAPRSVAMRLWFAQQALNWIWSPIFFAAQLLWPAFAVIAAIFVLIAAFIAVNWHRDRISALLFSPYLAWVGFASVLNLAIAVLN